MTTLHIPLLGIGLVPIKVENFPFNMTGDLKFNAVHDLILSDYRIEVKHI